MAVQVNLNALTRDGLIRVRDYHFEATPEYLDEVEIESDDMRGRAWVQQVNPVTKLVYLDVDWRSLH